MGIPVNTNLPANYRTPGIYTQLVLADPGAPAANNRALLVGIMGSTGIATPNTPFLAIGSEDVGVQLQPFSPLAKMYAAFKSQLPSGIGAEVWLLPLLEPSAGTAATHLIKFLAPPAAGVLGSGTAALVSHTCTLKIAGRAYPFAIASGDSFAAVAAKAKAALDLVTDLEVTVAIQNTSELLLTDRCKGIHGEDLAVGVEFSVPPAVGGVGASPGVLTFANGPAVGAGTASVRFGIRRASATIADTNTDAQSATALAAAINADSYPCTAAQPSVATGVVTLFYRSDSNARAIQRVSAALAVTATQTLAATVGTAGAGAPLLTSALTGLTADQSQAYRGIGVQAFDTTSWSALIAHIEAQQASPVEKGQTVYGCFTSVLPTQLSDSLADQTTPKASTSARYRLLWGQGSPVRAWELTARAVALAVSSAIGQNLNGAPLKTNEAVPFPLPHRADRPTADEIETAISTFRYTPLAVNGNGELAIVRSTTTFLAAGDVQRKLEKWSCIEILDYFRYALRVRLGALFGKSSVKKYGKARTPRCADQLGVQCAVFNLFKEWDLMDLYDGADGMREAITSSIQVSPTRIDVACPFRTVADLDQISIVGIQT